MTEYFAGLDVSVETTAICVVTRDGVVALEVEAPTDPAAIGAALAQPGLKALGLPAVCLETRHARAAMSAQRNKTGRNDALGLAHIVRTGWFRAAHVKTDPCYRLRLLLSQRRNLKRKFLDLENSIRHSLKAFGVRLGKVGRGGFERAVRAACADDRLTAELIDCMLRARAALWDQYLKLHASSCGWWPATSSAGGSCASLASARSPPCPKPARSTIRRGSSARATSPPTSA